jgi:hypothetical protein
MNIVELLKNDILTNIQRSPEFFLSQRPNLGEKIVLDAEANSFMCDGGTSGTWQISIDAESQIVILRLFVGEGLWAHLSLHSTGLFEGRDRINGGHMCVCPLHPTQWKVYTHPQRFLDTQHVKTSKGSFKYQDIIAPVKDFSFLENWTLELNNTPINNPAIVLLGYNRPHYFTKVVHSIAQNPQSRTWPIFIFLDRFEDDPTVSKPQIEAAFTSFPTQNLHIIFRDGNAGCGRNLIDARRQIFDVCGFERAYFFEDDMLVPSNYLTCMENLWTWAKTNYSNVGMVQGWNFCKWGPDKKKNHLADVGVTRSNLWGYSIEKPCWNAIAPQLYEYERLFLFCEYARRPHRSIMDWFNRTLGEGRPEIGDNPILLTAAEHDMFNTYFQAPPTGQDGATQVFTHAAGYVRLATRVNRGQYIGKQGIHMNPRLFSMHGLDTVSFEEYNEDTELTQFNLTHSVEN